MINVWNGKWSINNGSQNTSHEWVSVCVCECVSLCVWVCVCVCVFLMNSVRISDLLSVGFWNFGSFLRVWYTMQLWHAIPCAPYLRAINQGVYTIFLWKISYRRWFEAFLEIIRWIQCGLCFLKEIPPIFPPNVKSPTLTLSSMGSNPTDLPWGLGKFAPPPA